MKLVVNFDLPYEYTPGGPKVAVGSSSYLFFQA